MTRKLVHFILPFHCLLTSLTLTACSSTEAPAPGPVEIPSTSSSKPVETPEEELMADGKRYYQAELFTLARDSFQTLADQHALGAFAEYAEIKAADAAFELQLFDEARTAYETIIQNRPASRALPYLLLQAGRSHQLGYRGLGRSVVGLEKARAHYERLNEKAPSSIYAAMGRVYLSQIIEQLGDSERSVRDFYAKKNQIAAAEWREKTAAVVYDAARAKQQAQPEPATLTASLGSFGRTLQTAPKQNPSLPIGETPHKESAAAPALALIGCEPGDRSMVLLLVNGSLNPDELIKAHLAKRNGDTVEVSFPATSIEPQSISCGPLGTVNAQMNKGATVISLHTNKDPELFAIQNPARIAIVIGG